MPKVTRKGKSKIRPRKSLKRKHSETNNEKVFIFFLSFMIQYE